MKRRVGPGGRTVPFLPPDLRPFAMNGTRKKNNLGSFDSDQQPTPIGGAEYDQNESLPIDLFPKELSDRAATPAGGATGLRYDNDALIAKIANDTGILVATQVIDRGLIGRSVTVGVTPTKIITADYPRAYRIVNPSLIVGGTAVGTLLASGTRTTAGNTQADSIGVANYRDLHLFLDVTAVSGATPLLDIYAQAIDPVTLNWADTQLLYSGISATGTFYANPGSLGLSTDFAIRWEITDSLTFSVGYVLKEGLPGTGAGVGKTIFLGNSGVTVEAGFPLLEGQSIPFFLRENTELYAVANTPLDLRIFEL